MLTKRQAEILTIMRDQEEELVYERGAGGYINLDRVAARTVFSLLRMAAISADQFNPEPGRGMETFHINDTGKQLLNHYEKFGGIGS